MRKILADLYGVDRSRQRTEDRGRRSEVRDQRTAARLSCGSGFPAANLRRSALCSQRTNGKLSDCDC